LSNKINFTIYAKAPESKTPSMYKWLLLDADNTLMDFTKASHAAFESICRHFKLGKASSLYPIYQRYNLAAWKAFEDKQITADQLKVDRMSGFLQAIDNKVIDPTHLNKQYLHQLMLNSELYNGVEAILQELKHDYVMSIVTNGLKEVQRPRVHRLRLDQYFASIVVSDEIGIAKPDIRYFDYAYQTITNPPPKSDILIVGDSLHSDIKGGKNIGIATCWVSHGRKNTTAIQPDYTIYNFHELPALLNR
jgi:YjjG family noncanonical pyrimidine nucleotidase